VVAGEFGDVVAPQAPAHLEVFVGHATAHARVGADGGELLAQPADADAEDDAPARQRIERRDQLRRDDRVAVRQHVHADAEPHARRRRRQIRERHERLVELHQAVEHRRRRRRARIERVDARRLDRHHQMIGDPHRVEPQRLGVLGEADEILAARQRPVVGKSDADAHSASEPQMNTNPHPRPPQ
jgi:hypothetical protein